MDDQMRIIVLTNPTSIISYDDGYSILKVLPPEDSGPAADAIQSHAAYIYMHPEKGLIALLRAGALKMSDEVLAKLENSKQE